MYLFNMHSYVSNSKPNWFADRLYHLYTTYNTQHIPLAFFTFSIVRQTFALSFNVLKNFLNHYLFILTVWLMFIICSNGYDANIVAIHLLSIRFDCSYLWFFHRFRHAFAHFKCIFFSCAPTTFNFFLFWFSHLLDLMFAPLFSTGEFFFFIQCH